MPAPALILHGGAGARRSRDYTAEIAHMREVVEAMQARLLAGDAALDVAVKTLVLLEDSGLYVAGRGSSPNLAGEYELDASLMDGSTRRAGAVAAFQGYRNPIRAARAVMDHSPHVLLAGSGAARFAGEHGLEPIGDAEAWFTRAGQGEDNHPPGQGPVLSHGTVGCCVLDMQGRLAAATSTGGVFGKLPGRVGDTPIPAAGVWATDRVAVSCTGQGEYFIRTAAAAQMDWRVEAGASIVEAGRCGDRGDRRHGRRRRPDRPGCCREPRRPLQQPGHETRLADARRRDRGRGVREVATLQRRNVRRSPTLIRSLRKSGVSSMKSRLKSAVAALALVSALGTFAPAMAQSAPAGIAVPPLGFVKRTLPNGMDVYTSRDTTTSNVTVQVWYRVGSKDDPQDRSGFAHLFEHLMFKATKDFPDETFDRLTEDVGGNNNAFTSDDVTAYHETIPANHLERLLFAEASRLSSLVVNEDVFESERDVVKEEYRQSYLARPYGRLGLFLPALIYQESPYRRSTIGSIENLDAATIEDVRRFHATYYRPDNAILIVAGNFDQAQLDGWIDQYLAPIANPDRPLPANHVVEPEPTGPREATVYAPNVPLPAVVLAWPTVAYRDADRIPLTVLDGIMSTGESSRLYRSLVYEQQIAAQATSSPDFSQQAGYMSATAIMAGGKTPEEGLTALRAEVARFRDEPVTAAELAEAKNELVADALRSRETIDDRANVLGFALIETNDASVADREIAEIQAVTAADIQRVARRYLTDNRAVTMRYLAADDEHPVTTQVTAVTAPVQIANLAPVGQVFTLLPEAERARLPATTEPVAPTTPPVADFRLDNGMRVLVVEKTGLPLVSARLSFGAGSADDLAGKAGVASMTAGLLTQGTATRSAPEIATEIEQLGADVGAGAGVDFSNVFANAPANVFPQAMALMADLVRNPAFSDEELDRLRTQSLDGLRIALTTPGTVAGMAAGRVIYGDAAYGSPGGGTVTTLPAITRDDVVAFHHRRYRPSDATLVFSGDIDEAEARTLAQSAFGDWRDTNATADARVSPVGQALPPRIVVIDQPGAGQAAVTVALRGVSRTDADYFPLTLGNTLLGGSFTSRLNQEIRIKRGLSYGTRSGLGVRREDGLFTASAQTRNDAAVEVSDLILAEITRLSTTRPTASELTTRQAILTGAFGDQLETVDGLGGLVAGLALYDLPMSELAAYVGNVEAIDGAGVQSAFAEHLPVDRASLVIVGDAAQFIDALRAKHPNVEVIPISELNLDNAALK